MYWTKVSKCTIFHSSEFCDVPGNIIICRTSLDLPQTYTIHIHLHTNSQKLTLKHTYMFQIYTCIHASYLQLHICHTYCTYAYTHTHPHTHTLTFNTCNIFTVLKYMLHIYMLISHTYTYVYIYTVLTLTHMSPYLTCDPPSTRPSLPLSGEGVGGIGWRGGGGIWSGEGLWI